MTTVYRFTIHDETGARIDDTDNEMTENQLLDATRAFDHVVINGQKFWSHDGMILSYVSERI